MPTALSKAEVTAMQERAAELRAAKGGRKKADNLQPLLDRVDELPAADQEIAVALHRVMTEVAPELSPRTWYGMPAYEQDGEVVVFLQVASKFNTRYFTLGFNQAANLDDRGLWPTHYAIPALTPGVKDRMATLVARATRPRSHA